MTEPLKSLSAASFHKPLAKPPSAWVGHAPFAFWVVEAHRPRSIVELGTHFGYSFLCMCQQIRTMQLDATCIAVDTWMGDEHAGFYDDSIYGNLRAYQQSMYRDFSHMLRMTFDEALSHIPDGSVDLLHLDGRHFYEDIKHDYETWKPKLSERGIVLFHDTQVRERNFGVWKFWAELRDHYPSFEFEHQHGLGVLGVGSAPEVQNFPLFREGADPEIAQRIRLGYQALGGMLDGPALRRNTECPCGSGMKYKHCHGSYA